MPANKKYLNTSGWQKFAKISSGFLGGYLVSMTLHLAIAAWLYHINMIITMTFTGFVLWMVLMILAFLGKNGWKIWGYYLVLSLLFCLFLFLGKNYNPYFLS